MSFSPAPVEFQPVLPAEYTEVRLLAEQIWPEVYASIITPGQIEYMISRMYATETIAREVHSKGIAYHWITLNGGKIGFFAFGPLQSGSTAHLHKLYVLPEHHGRGIGSAVLSRVIHELRQVGACRLELRVNRNNRAAIRCYERNGFKRIAEDCLDIGGGFVMDDFIMVHPLAGDKVDFSIAPDE